MFDLIIIGGGPAGVTAGVYAARKKINTAIISESFHGQSVGAGDIQNWIGMKSVSGYDLAKMMEDHLFSYKDALEIVEGEKVSKVEKTAKGFKVHVESGREFEAKTVLVASGGGHRRMNIPGEKELEGKGVSYCSTCDAPIFKGKNVAVVGGGNAGLETVVDLMNYAKHISLLEYGDILKGDQVTQDKIKKDPRVEIITNAETLEVVGKDFVSGLKYKDRKSGKTNELKIDGLFVQIGMSPNSFFVKDLVELSKFGEIVVDHRTQAASIAGVWAAGDVTDNIYRQNNIAAGDAAKAVLNINDYLIKSSGK
jgi:alkyl hydroperoxide reductase subunit F